VQKGMVVRDCGVNGYSDCRVWLSMYLGAGVDDLDGSFYPLECVLHTPPCVRSVLVVLARVHPLCVVSAPDMYSLYARALPVGDPLRFCSIMNDPIIASLRLLLALRSRTFSVESVCSRSLKNVRSSLCSDISSLYARALPATRSARVMILSGSVSKERPIIAPL
jgi:hypothetical protein